MCYIVHMASHDTELNVSTTLTLRMQGSTKAKLEKLAQHTRRTKSFLANEAIEGYVDRELEIVAAINRGLADMAAGRVVPHAEVMAEIDATIDAAEKARES